MNEIEIDYCDICHKKKPIQRKYYYYDINCECCGSQYGHFEIVRYCKDCVPVPPHHVTVEMEPYQEN